MSRLAGQATADRQGKHLATPRSKQKLHQAKLSRTKRAYSRLLQQGRRPNSTPLKLKMGKTLSTWMS